MALYPVGDTEQFFADGNVVLTDAMMREIHPSVHMRVADWREARFGVRPSDAVLAAVDHEMFGNSVWLLGPRDGLPRGDERVWARGIWVNLSWNRERGVWQR